MKIIEHYIFFEDAGWFELFKLEGIGPRPYKWARSFRHLIDGHHFVMPISEKDALKILENISI